MTESVTPTSGGSSTTSGVSGAAPQQTEAAKSSFRTMEELRREDPKLYQTILQGIAMQMCNQIKRQADRLKELQRRWRKDSGIS